MCDGYEYRHIKAGSIISKTVSFVLQINYLIFDAIIYDLVTKGQKYPSIIEKYGRYLKKQNKGGASREA